MSLGDVRKELRGMASPEQAANLQRFFKTGPGEYGEGDVFLGLKVPQVRAVCKEHADLGRSDVTRLLHSKIHEERLLALLILVLQFSKGDSKGRKSIYECYLANTRYVNNWDLVDLSAPNIVGTYLLERNRRPLYSLAKSKNLWERRISILATAAFIRVDDFDDTLGIAWLLLGDEHDLIHKAVGWMLREVGKRDRAAEEGFLREHYRGMPRTMLRYAIERFPERLRQRYLRGKWGVNGE